MMKIAVFLMFTAVSVRAEPCCTPGQWEGMATDITGSVVNGQTRSVQVNTLISYDFENKMAVISVAFVGPSITRNTTIFNFSENKMYTVHEETGTCVISNIDMDMKEACVPDDGKEMGNFYYGEPGNLLEATTFIFTVSGMQGVVTVTKEGCIPVTEVVYGTVGTTSAMSVVGFSNITPGIKDPTVFDPPSICDQKQAKTLKKLKVHSTMLGLPTSHHD